MAVVNVICNLVGHQPGGYPGAVAAPDPRGRHRVAAGTVALGASSPCMLSGVCS